jgi:uncharacterized protein YyaL (SSP411 family)
MLKMVEKTLASIWNGLCDYHDRGFFRYSVSRDWRVPHYEKMLVTNTNLAVVYLEAYQVAGKTVYRHAASGALDYLLGVLFDSARSLFYASQDAGEEYYRLPWKDRVTSPKPAIDLTHYTSWNSQGAAALIKAGGVLGQLGYFRTARQVLDLIWSESWSPDIGLAHVVGESLRQPPVLEDQVHFIRASLALHQATGDSQPLERAVVVVNQVQERFRASDGGFYDVSASSSSQQSFLAREKPVLENSLLAEALVTLAYLTGNDEHLSTAREILETFQGVVPGHCYLGPQGSRRMEEDEEQLFLPAGSTWARAWDLLTYGPVHLVLVGPARHPSTRDLLRAALKVYAQHQVVQVLDPEFQQERIAKLSFPIGREPSIYACMGGMCLAPVTTSREVRALATDRPWAA